MRFLPQRTNIEILNPGLDALHVCVPFREREERTDIEICHVLFGTEILRSAGGEKRHGASVLLLEFLLISVVLVGEREESHGK